MFKKFMHVERIDSDEVEGILNGTVHIMPKIDGTNGSVWFEDGMIYAGSRNRGIDPGPDGEDNQGFFDTILTNYPDKLNMLQKDYPHWRLYGEFLVPHSLKTYQDAAWRKFYIFDVLDDETETFIPYEKYQPALEQCGLDYIPVIATLKNATPEKLLDFIEKNVFLIRDGCGYGEGIVVKRYDYVNRYGRVTWAKVVANVFKEKHTKEMGGAVVEYRPTTERDMAQQYVTLARIDKMLQEMGDWNQKRIPELFSRIYHDLVVEELWDFIKERKNKVTIDFAILYHEVITTLKAVKPELF